ncbi:MAG: Uma2 family endonuclease [Janthinobacterium lividum]
MATTSTILTMDEYLHTSYSPDVDFVDGEIEERNSGEFDHGYLQGLFFAWFLERKERLKALPVVEQRIRVAHSRVRICNIAVVTTGRREQVTSTAPLVCIEVLSPEDRVSRAEKVLADYLQMGVPNIWLIDPYRRAAFFYNADGLHMAADNILHVAGTDIALEMDTLFEALDETNA